MNAATNEGLPPLTLQECADELRVPVSIIRRHIRAGTLVALALSPNADPHRRGPKCYRVERAEWDRFKREARTRAAEPAPDPAAEPGRRKAGRPKTGEVRAKGRMGDYL